MKILTGCIFILLAAGLPSGETYADRLFNSLNGHDKESRQLLAVRTKNWDAAMGSMQRYQRDASFNHNKWVAIGDAIPVVVGKHGMAWGIAWQQKGLAGPVKREGDLRTPAGIFKIPTVFGFNEKPEKNIKLPYLPLTSATFCIDDIKSKYYNQIVDSAKIIKPDWSSAEQMRSVPLYKWGAVISYNTDRPVPGAGSCIFMHTWRNATTGTTGCIAMEKADLERVLTWLDPLKNPVIAVFPEDKG